MKIFSKENINNESNEYGTPKNHSEINIEALQQERTDNLINLFLSQSKALGVLKGDKIGINFEDLENEVHHSLFKQAQSMVYRPQKKVNLSAKKTFCYSQFKSTNNNLISNSKIQKKKTSISIDKAISKEEIFMEKIYKKGLIPKKLNEIQRKKDQNNPYIYSYDDWHPFSFCTGHRKWGYENGVLKAPSPIFLDNEEWCKKKDMTINSILAGIVINEEDGLVLVDPTVCAKFSGILGDLIKQIIQAIFGRKISLNVRLFEPKSLTETLTSYFSHAPKFLPQGANPSLSPVDRMKYVIALGVGGLYMNAKQLKPFNPLICETFQGYFDVDNLDDDKNKIEVYSEQITNYPTATRYYIVNKSFKMYGYFDLMLEMKNCGNKIICITKGFNTVDFFNLKEKISFSIPNVKLMNAISQENRSAHYCGAMMFYDIKNKLRGFIQFGKDKKHISNFKGYIYKYDFPKDYKFDFDKENDEFTNIKIDDIEKNDFLGKNNVLSKITGSWLGNICFDGVKYWDIYEDIPTYIRPCFNCLPSDSRFREDLIWLYRSFYKANDEEERIYYEKLAQNWKLMIEKVQREERTAKAKLNEELAKKMKDAIGK